LRNLATGLGMPILRSVPDTVLVASRSFFAIVLTLLAAAPAFARAQPAVSVGAYLPGADQNPSLIDDFSQQVGRPTSFLISYKDWDQAPFVYDQLEGIWNHGAVPLITWEPWERSLRGIARGDYDGYVWDSARAAAGWGRPLMVRFGQEMNGDWFPWGGQRRAFKAAWRHLVGIFRSAGADNVRWVWNPYVNSRGGHLSFAGFFPGAKWVDWVGLDAVNWGAPFPWRTFRQIAGRSYRQLISLTSKPVIIAEAGSGESGGSKSHWLSEMLRRNIPRMRHVRAVSFWSVPDPRGDLRVDSSAGALAAVRAALSEPLYESSRRTLLRTPTRIGG
jgi:hypothetical protein